MLLDGVGLLKKIKDRLLVDLLLKLQIVASAGHLLYLSTFLHERFRAFHKCGFELFPLIIALFQLPLDAVRVRLLDSQHVHLLLICMTVILMRLDLLAVVLEYDQCVDSFILLFGRRQVRQLRRLRSIGPSLAFAHEILRRVDLRAFLGRLALRRIQLS